MPVSPVPPYVPGEVSNLVAVTKSDEADVASSFVNAYGEDQGGAKLYVGVAGDVAVTLANMKTGTSVVLKSLAAGVWHNMRVKRVWSTGTTATNMVAGW